MSISLAAGIVNLFFYCFLGKTATESYSVYANCLYFTNWLKLSVDQQQLLILMIRSAQRPMVYRGFDIFPLNLDTFTKVCTIDNLILTICYSLFNNFKYFKTLKTVTSYYMMFKTLSE